MLRYVFFFGCMLLINSLSSGQRITLHHLMGFHSLADTEIDRQLRRQGWRYYGVQRDVLRKPRMYALAHEGIPQAQLFLYNYQRKPLCKVELVSRDIDNFNLMIRDSMNAYGFVPDTGYAAPDDENLQITSSASYITQDGSRPVRALILYYEERRHPKVSLTIYGED